MNQGEWSVSSILQNLWAPGAATEKFRIYAVLDGARDSAVNTLLQQSPRQPHCLYFEPLSHKLRLAAPKLVELGYDSFAQSLLEQGWGASWGIFVRVPARLSLNRLRHQLRKMNFVEGPKGQRLLFRYYDPRVLRIFLRTCSTGELDLLFQSITDIFMEDDSGQTLLQYHHTQKESCLTRYNIATSRESVRA